MSTATMAMSRKERKGKARVAAQEEKPTAAMPLGKQLAHTDKKVRDRAVANLVAFLSRGSGGESSTFVKLEESEMSKLWKGLFYCFWMSDKPLVQQALAADLAELVLLINPAVPQGSKASAEETDSIRFGAAVSFLEGFWASIVREWEGLDKHRMDKFYLLIRRYVNATFRLLARHGWSTSAVQTINELLSRKGSGPLSWHDRKVPISLAMHLSDVCLEELDKVLALPEVDSQPACPLPAILQPYMALLANTPSQIVHDRLMLTLFRPLLDALALASPSADLDARPKKRTKRDSEPMFAHVVMHSTTANTAASSASATAQADRTSSPDKLRSAVIQGMFIEAAKEGSVESNRRKVYKLYREEGGDDDEDEE